MKKSPFKKRPHQNQAPADPTRGLRAVPGFHSLNEVRKVRPKTLESLWVRKDWMSVREIIEIQEWAVQQRIPFTEKAASELDRITTGHQGVIGWVNSSPSVDWEDLKSKSQALVVALDGVEDPHNLGAILRTAWLMKAEALFVPEARAAHLTPTAVKVACGGAEHVPVEIESNLPHLLQSLKDMGFWVFGLSHKARRDLWQMEMPEKVAWVIGSESKGLRTPVERMCDELVSIPQASAAASYNASVAAAIAMTETQRQWQSK